MKRWLLIVLMSGVVALSVYVSRSIFNARAQARREAAYQSALHFYSQALHPGSTRKDVEMFLKANRTRFEQICCIKGVPGYSDLVKIGEEEHPWYCSENYVFIALQFAEVPPFFQPHDTDVFRGVSMFRRLGGCL
jgi:hypothetical protein